MADPATSNKRHSHNDHEETPECSRSPASTRPASKRPRFEEDEDESSSNGGQVNAEDDVQRSNPEWSDTTAVGLIYSVVQQSVDIPDDGIRSRAENSSLPQLPATFGPIISQGSIGNSQQNDQVVSRLRDLISDGTRSTRSRKDRRHSDPSFTPLEPKFSYTPDLVSHRVVATDPLIQQRQFAQHHLSSQRSRIRDNPRAKWITAPAPNPFRRVLPGQLDFGQAEDSQQTLLRIMYGGPR